VVEQLGLGPDPGRGFAEVGEQLELQSRERDGVAGVAGLELVGVDLERPTRTAGLVRCPLARARIARMRARSSS